MQYFLGIDGGGSHTRAVICNQFGRVLGLGHDGPSNIHELSGHLISKHLSEAITQALPQGNEVSIYAAFMGIAGVVSPDDRTRTYALAHNIAQLQKTRIEIDHDIRSALAGGLAGQPGIALIVGTGSSCYGRNHTNKTYQCGGWGSLVDDIGSGSWIGLRALQEAVRQTDGRASETKLRSTVFDFLQIKSIEYFLGHIHRKRFSRTRRAQLAPIIIQLHEAGDLAATSIIEDAIDGLVELVGVTACQLQLQPAPIVLAGGLTQNRTFTTLLKQAIIERVPGSKIIPAQLTPLLGSALLAAQCNQIPITQDFIHQLKNTT